MFWLNKSCRRVFLYSFTLIIVLLLGFIFFYIDKQSSIYPYDTAKDYFYEIDQREAFLVDVELSDGQLIVPELARGYQTAFLKLNLKTSLMGRYFIPSVELTSGDASVVDFLEHGAMGSRYINISRFLGEENSAVENREPGSIAIQLNGHRVNFPDQKAQLVLYKNPDIKKSRVLIMAPHPDDAEIAAYDLYSNSGEAFVVTVTAGDAGGKSYGDLFPNPKMHYLKKGMLRTWNSLTVPMLGGVPSRNILNLGYFDATLKKMYRKKSVPVKSLYTENGDVDVYRRQNGSELAVGLKGQANWTSLVENIEYLLKEIQPDVIVSPSPKLDSHKDHQFTTIALIQAIKNSGLKDGELYLYSNHFWLNEFFPYGEEGGLISLPPNFDDGLYFDRIYSHTLSREGQGDKVLALDAMNDLRSGPQRRFLHQSIDSSYKQLVEYWKGEQNSYYKRSVRDNELFFVVDISNLYNDEILKKIMGDSLNAD